MRAQQPRGSRLRSLLSGGIGIALTGCALINSKQPNVSAQPPAEKQTGAVYFFEQAQKLEQEKKFAEAADLYAKIIADDPSQRSSYDALIRIQLGLKQTESAKEVAKTYRDQFPKSATPLLSQAAVFSQLNQLEQAEATYRDGMNRFPKNEEFILGLSLTLGKLARLSEAGQLLDSKIANSDHWSSTLYALRAQIVLMEPAADESSKTAAIRQAITFLTTATKKSPELSELWLQKSELERALREYPAATQSMEMVLQLNPDNTRISEALVPLYLQQARYTDLLGQIKRMINQPNEQTDKLIDLAVRHALSTGKMQEAITLSHEVAQLLPDHVDSQFLYGFALIQNKRFEEAEAVLAATRAKLYEAQPNSFDPRLELYYGIALLQQDQTEKGTEVLSELAAQQFDAELSNYLQLLFSWNDTPALTRLVSVLHSIETECPNSPYVSYFKALILQQKHAYPDALEAFCAAEKKADSLAEKKADFLDDNFYFQLASLHERCGQFDQAADLFRKTIALNPQRADAMNYLAYMWAENKTHLDEAHVLITQALEIDPESGAFLDTLGWIYYQKGEYKNAMQALIKSVELEQNDPTIYDHLGDCARQLDRPQDARNYWLKSLSIAPDTTIQEKVNSIPTK